MKTLVLIRHAKSSWKSPDLKDLERPLKKKGVKDASRMGTILKEIPVTPDCILSSPAARALATANLISKEYGLDKKDVQVRPDLYLEPASRLLQQIQELGDEYEVVFLVSHNPGLMDIASALIGNGIDKFPAGAALGVSFNCSSWREAGAENAQKLFFETPKKHRKNGKAKGSKETTQKDKEKEPSPKEKIAQDPKEKIAQEIFTEE